MAYRGIIGNNDGADRNNQDNDSFDDVLTGSSKDVVPSVQQRNKLPNAKARSNATNSQRSMPISTKCN
ncbi:hypothetical protein AWZ03_014648, partial [Drosophila navojoa]